jgi:hypothetical protein
VGVMTQLLTRLSRIKRFKEAVGLLMIILALFATVPWLNPMAITSHMAVH